MASAPNRQAAGILNDWPTLILSGSARLFAWAILEDLADLRQIVAGLHRVSLLALRDGDLMRQIGEIRIDRLDRIPHVILAGFRDNRGTEVKFVTLQVESLNGSVFLGENVQDGLVFLLQLIQVSHGALL